jgi:hypothetical protein
MSPQNAIENGFADGYITYGAPITGAVASTAGIIPEDKARIIMQMLKNRPGEDKESGNAAVPDITNIKGEMKMTLKELLAANPEAQAEVDQMVSEAREQAADTAGTTQEQINQMVNAAREEGIQEERERLKSLDAIAATVKPEALTEAKYGKNPTDGKTLAFEAMVGGEKLARAYMAQVVDDSDQSGVNEVGTGNLNDETVSGDAQDSDSLAAYINQTKGVK